MPRLAADSTAQVSDLECPDFTDMDGQRTGSDNHKHRKNIS